MKIQFILRILDFIRINDRIDIVWIDNDDDDNHVFERKPDKKNVNLF